MADREKWWGRQKYKNLKSWERKELFEELSFSEKLKFDKKIADQALNKSPSCLEMLFLSIFKTLFGILYIVQ